MGFKKKMHSKQKIHPGGAKAQEIKKIQLFFFQISETSL